MTEAITREMRELQQAVYEAADAEGLKLPGRSDWSDLETVRVGSKDTPGADIGMSGEMTVAVGADGQLVNQARNRAPGDAPSTHLLRIRVSPFVDFGDDGNVAHIRWLANVNVTELTKARIVVADDSSDDAAIKAMQGGRSYEEYMNDPEYREARLDFHHETPGEAVRAALKKISSGGVINLPDAPPPTTAAPSTSPDVSATNGSSSDSAFPIRMVALGALGLLFVVAAVILGLNIFGGGDDELSTTGPATPGAEPDDSADDSSAAATTDGDDAGATTGNTAGDAASSDSSSGDTVDEAPVPSRTCGGDFPSDTTPGNAGSFLHLPSPNGCQPGPASYSSGGCDADYLPCFTGTTTYSRAGDAVGIGHSTRTVDPITGQLSNSTVFFLLWALWFGDPGDAFVQITSDCGGNTLTGRAPLINGGITTVDGPLQNFGSCTVTDAYIGGTGGSGEMVTSPIVDLIGTTYEVGPGEPEAIPPSVTDEFVVGAASRIPADWPGAALTVNGAMRAAPIDGNCFWFFAPDNVELLVKVLDGCQSDSYWVFAAGLTNVEVTLTVTDTVVGHGGAAVSSLGPPASPVDETNGFALSESLFNNTVFPCGFSDVAYTACPDNDLPVDAGAFVSVSAAMLDTIPIEPDGASRSHTIDFGPSSGPAYTVAQDADGWSISSSAGDTRARALFRDNSLTVVAPQDELPEGALSYVWSTTVDGQTATQPASPVIGIITTPTITADGEVVAEDTADAADSSDATASDGPSETLDEFYMQLSASVASGDLGFTIDRLHPAVLEAYPTQCPAALESFADPDFSIEFVSEGETAPWTWEVPDGPSLEIPDAIVVNLIVSGRGQAGTEAASHVALVDGQYRWFTFCT